MSKKYQIKFTNGKICVDRTPAAAEQNNTSCGTIRRNNNKIEFVPDSVDENFDQFFENLSQKITCMNLSQKNTNDIIDLLEEFVVANSELYTRVFEKQNGLISDTADVLSKTKSYVLTKIKSIESTYRRNELMKKNPIYVEPVEKAMGLKWNTKNTPQLDIPDHRIAQTKFSFVKISDTLRSLFSVAEFKSLFIRHNESKHNCIEGEYIDYCCGNISKNNAVFRSKDTVVIQLGIDEFEVCCGLKSKSTKHKIFGVYFHIRNMPIKYASKLDNIKLVALCPSNNFKESGCCDDNVIEEIVRDLQVLERDGINVGDNAHLKVSLFNISCDNLGANVLFGFAQSFAAEYYCRFCECLKVETKEMVNENVTKRRSKESYNHQIERLAASPDLGLKDTKGIKKNCLFNRLNSFHVSTNLSIDIMHDIFEGVIPFFLKSFFQYCVDHGISTHSDLIRRIRDFNYGTLNTRNKPSLLQMSSGHLGQCAIQLYCIMIHMPFIFIDLRDRLIDIWPIMTSLLECLKIVCSYKIRECDIQQLIRKTEEHLSAMITHFNIKLKPKHHNLLHYPHVIREMGPLKLMWMMRYESKHKYFTDSAKKTQNFINITKSLSISHQKYICTKQFSYTDDIHVSSKKRKLTNCSDYSLYRPFLSCLREYDLSSLISMLFIKINSNEYRKGLMVLHEKMLFEIVHVLCIDSKNYILCHKYEVIRFDEKMNSFVIEKSELNSENVRLININDLTIDKCYEKKYADHNIYLIAESLDIFLNLCSE